MWYQLQIENCHQHEIDNLSLELEEAGALSITLSDKNDDPILEPDLGTTPLWPETVINALFDDKHHAEAVKNQVEQKHPNYIYTIKIIEDQDWERAWMENFKPQCFGKRLWICPSWLTPPEPNAVNLILDPGLAFGTGTHPTTSLCLQWLDQADLQNKTLIDYGCGSGILALAALKLGAQTVTAIDIDPQALEATKNNALTNQLFDDNKLKISFAADVNQPVDLIMANILLTPLISLKAQFHTLLKPEGQLIVSGILKDQVEQLCQEYQTNFIHQATFEQDGWALLVFKRS